MTTTLAPRTWLRHGASALGVMPLLWWLIAHHSVAYGQPWRTRRGTCASALRPTACGPSGRCRACRQRARAPPFGVEGVAVAAIGLLIWSG